MATYYAMHLSHINLAVILRLIQLELPLGYACGNLQVSSRFLLDSVEATQENQWTYNTHSCVMLQLNPDFRSNNRDPVGTWGDVEGKRGMGLGGGRYEEKSTVLFSPMRRMLALSRRHGQLL